ncbi:MAG: hypothetical protein GF405_07425 [Candidatus Eisenbacteria bacterium]|nr:hypothetical protein [Candidatus Eisenbacteria bacterium]
MKTKTAVMNGVAALLLISLLAVPAAGAAGSGHERTVVDSFYAPGGWPKGIEWVDDGGDGFLYHADDYSSIVFTVTTEGDWAVLCDVGDVQGDDDVLMCAGLCRVPDEPYDQLYVTDSQGHQTRPMFDVIYQLTTNGALVDTFGVEWFCDYVTGICHDGTDFWLCSDWGTVYRCDAAFDPLESFPLSECQPQGIDYDPATGLFYLVNNQLNRIEVRDSDMNLVGSFPAPSYEPFGISIGRVVGESRTLWLTDTSTDLFYKVTDEHYTPVEQGSWGALKTRFR